MAKCNQLTPLPCKGLRKKETTFTSSYLSVCGNTTSWRLVLLKQAF